MAVVAVVAVSTAITQDRGREDAAGPRALAGAPADPACVAAVVRSAPMGVTVPAFETPREAAEAWAGPGAGTLSVDTATSYAFLRRADGSVRAWMRLESTRVDLEDGEPAAWSVDGSALCADEPSALPWDGADELDCATERRVTGAVGREARPGEERYGLLLEPGSLEGVASAMARPDVERAPLLTRGASSSDVTVTHRRGGRVALVTRLVHAADRWRVERVALCPALAPRVAPGAKDLRLIGLHVGHCWINELRHDGRDWTALAADDFGWGGAVPDAWIGFGEVERDGERLVYDDLGGRRVTFLPTGSPGTTHQCMCA